MKQISKPSAIIKWKGELMQVLGYSNEKVIYFQPINTKPCELCGERKQYAIAESSPHFQENAEAVETIENPHD